MHQALRLLLSLLALLVLLLSLSLLFSLLPFLALGDDLDVRLCSVYGHFGFGLVDFHLRLSVLHNDPWLTLFDGDFRLRLLDGYLRLRLLNRNARLPSLNLYIHGLLVRRHACLGFVDLNLGRTLVDNDFGAFLLTSLSLLALCSLLLWLLLLLLLRWLSLLLLLLLRLLLLRLLLLLLRVGQRGRCQQYAAGAQSPDNRVAWQLS